MEHLVVHDVRYEVPRDPGAIQHRVDADEALEARIASELYREARLVPFARAPPSPRDECVACTVEVAGVELVEEREEIVMLALGVQRDRARTSPREPGAVRLDVVSDDLARRAIV